MQNKNNKILALGIFILCAWGLGSQYIENRKHEKDVSVPAPAIYECRMECIDKASDSIMTIQGMPLTNIYAEQAEILRDSIAKMEYQNSLSGNLDTNVKKACKPIVNAYMMKVCNLLKANNIDYDKATIDYVKQCMWPNGVFMAYDEHENADCKWERLSIVGNIERLLDSEDYEYNNYAKNNEIKEEIRHILLNDMCKAIYKNRKSVEARYAKYVDGGIETINKNSVFYVEDSCFLNYDKLNDFLNTEVRFEGSTILNSKIENAKQSLSEYENKSKQYEETAAMVRERAIWVVDSQKAYKR